MEFRALLYGQTTESGQRDRDRDVTSDTINLAVVLETGTSDDAVSREGLDRWVISSLGNGGGTASANSHKCKI